MAKITREEVLKLANISRLEIQEAEIEQLAIQLESVLSYSERVCLVAADIQEPSQKNVNFFRNDAVVSTDADPILAQAPMHEEHFFVVPRILEND